jgi:hypothetical protein
LALDPEARAQIVLKNASPYPIIIRRNGSNVETLLNEFSPVGLAVWSETALLRFDAEKRTLWIDMGTPPA